MLSSTLIIRGKAGLHTRPASRLVKLAKGFDATIELSHSDQKASARSIIQLLKLGVTKGSEITLTVSGNNPQPAFDEIHQFLSALED
ncbi:HPr family phosphocarrier protein [Endozoicomonas sp. Mp262]|uniref:HPr family phosphocarrier protein n=1 Tax=Endozoicomonas sp. Mp262 TaxID=2919499 RepID=UPI0021DA9F0D